MERTGKMTKFTRFAAFVTGIFLLIVSIYWSQDGFNFDLAGASGYTDFAVLVGYGIAVAVTVMQFVFSSNFRYLNPSLLLFGLMAYGYSIYTNWQGIIHWQGTDPNKLGAIILGIGIDGVPEPLIAWSLAESLTGDFIGNLMKGIGSGFMIAFNSFDAKPSTANKHSETSKPLSMPMSVKKGKGRQFQESHRSSTKPNGGFESLMRRMEDDGARKSDRFFE